MTRWPNSYPFALFVALIALLPIIVLIFLAADSPQLFDSRNGEILGNTVLLMLFTVLGAVLIGVPLAFMTAYVKLPYPRFWLVLLAAPLAIPSYIGAFTLYAAFGPGGEIEQLTGFATPSFDGLFGASAVMALYTYPFVMLTVRASLLSLDASLVNAARTLGMTLFGSLWFVVLPRIFNSVAAGALLAAMYALSDFGTPAMLGLDTFTRMIYVEYNSFGLSQAAMLSLQLLVIVGVILVIESNIKGTKERPGTALMVWPSRTQSSAMLMACLPVVFLAIMLPLIIFGVWAWREGVGNFELSYALNSAYAALLAAIAATIFALPVAQAALHGKFGRVMERVSYLGFGVPGIVMGTALVYVGLKFSVMYQTLGLLILAYVMRFLPLAVGAIRSNIERLDPSLSHAARMLGASPREVFQRITLPLSMRGVIAGAALVFLEVMRELPATLILSPFDFETLATYLWRVYEAGYFGQAAIPGLLLVVISGLALAVMFYGENREQTDIVEEALST